MEISVELVTPANLMREATAFTTHNPNKEIKCSDEKLYASMHSPIRCRLFMVKMYGIPSFVSTHLVRHKIGVEHFVESNRVDRGGDESANRNTPVNHAMLINAEALITMSHKRLCSKSSKETIEVFKEIKNKIKLVDPALYNYLVPRCWYRGGLCDEFHPCGMRKSYNNYSTEVNA